MSRFSEVIKVRLTPEQRRALESYANSKAKTMSVVARELIQEWMQDSLPKKAENRTRKTSLIAEEPAVYGADTLKKLAAQLEQKASELEKSAEQDFKQGAQHIQSAQDEVRESEQ
ncbi:MAG: hypothetical protein AAF571_03355 [Verrucomicrobiota bacterium]